MRALMAKLPTKDEILDWLRDNPRNNAKREIARAFGIKGQARVELKRLLREMQDEGLIERKKKRVTRPGHLSTIERPVSRPVGVMWVSNRPCRGYASSSAAISGSAARVSPTDTACTQMRGLDVACG